MRRQVGDDLKIKFARYMIATPLSKCNALCLYWKHQTTEMTILSRLSKGILLIQASSGKSERRFSCSGTVVNEERSRLEHEAVESLTVLKEVQLNELWPKKL